MRLFAGFAFGLLFASLSGGCGDDDTNGQPFEVSVQAEIVEMDETVEVAARAIEEDDEGRYNHTVSVTWDGDQQVTLDDARFTHDVGDGGDGRLVTAGRGCSAEWLEDLEQVSQICTDDLQIITLHPGETHDYPVRIYPEVGPVELERGTYVLEEAVEWWRVDDPSNPRAGDADGEFRIRLTYEVE